MGDEVFKRRLACGVALLIAAWNNFVPLFALHWNVNPILRQFLNEYAVFLCIP